MKEMTAREMLDAVNELRILVFMECDGEGCLEEGAPEGRHFHQVMLTREQFKTVSNAIVNRRWEKAGLRDGFEMVETRQHGTFPADPFDGLASVNDPNE